MSEGTCSLMRPPETDFGQRTNKKKCYTRRRDWPAGQLGGWKLAAIFHGLHYLGGRV